MNSANNGEEREIPRMKWKVLIYILVILGGFFVILIFIINVWSDFTNLRCISSTPEMIVFQTGPFKPLEAVVSKLVFLLFSLYFFHYMISQIKNLKNEIQSLNKITMEYTAITFLGFCLSVFLIFFMINDISNSSISDKIVISNYEKTIEIERQYLLKNEEHIRISFDGIDHILYGYYYGRDYAPPYAEVKITRLDGMKIEIYSDYFFHQNEDNLARAIARATGKELIEKEYR